MKFNECKLGEGVEVLQYLTTPDTFDLWVELGAGDDSLGKFKVFWVRPLAKIFDIIPVGVN